MLTRLAAALGASLCLCLAVYALATTWAALGALSVRPGVNAQYQAHAGLTWRDANLRLQRARWIQPLDAQYSADLGRLYAFLALKQPVGNRAAAAMRDRALQYYAEAIAKRPAWARAWASLAETRAIHAGVSAALVHELERAVALAPWDPLVQLSVVWVGFASWHELPQSLQAQVQRTLVRAIQLENRLDHVFRLALDYGQESRLRSVLTNPEHIRLLDALQADRS